MCTYYLGIQQYGRFGDGKKFENVFVRVVRGLRRPSILFYGVKRTTAVVKCTKFRTLLQSVQT